MSSECLCSESVLNTLAINCCLLDYHYYHHRTPSAPVVQHRCYIVATCDKDLKRRLRKVPGVPIMFISQRKFAIERFGDVGAPKV